jgi:hypothetical protein
MDIVSWGTEGGGLKVEFRLDAGRLRVEHGNGELSVILSRIFGDLNRINTLPI